VTLYCCYTVIEYHYVKHEEKKVERKQGETWDCDYFDYLIGFVEQKEWRESSEVREYETEKQKEEANVVCLKEKDEKE
jgi:hypothetical protein